MTVTGLKKQVLLAELLLSIVIFQPFDRVNAFSNVLANSVFQRPKTSVAYVNRNILFDTTSGIDTTFVDETPEMNAILVDETSGIIAKEPLNAEQKTQLKALGKLAPKIVEMWLALAIEKGLVSRVGVQQIIKDFGPIPEDEGAMAHWIVALLNPLVDIKGAVNSCKNDFQRLEVVTLALQANIDNLSGNRVVF